MKKKLPSCVVDTTDGMRVLGMLFMRNERVVVMLNNLCTDADLGPLSSVRDHQIDPEADLYVIPADRVIQVTEIARS